MIEKKCKITPSLNLICLKERKMAKSSILPEKHSICKDKNITSGRSLNLDLINWFL
jgi:hypothetical protein